MLNSDEPFEDRAATAQQFRRRVKWVASVAVITLVAVLVIFWASPGGPTGRAAVNKQIVEQSRQISQQCLIYASEFSDRLPPHLAALVLRGMNVRLLVNPVSKAPPPVQPEAGDPRQWAKIATEIDAQSIFTYVGKDLKQNDNPAIIIFYTRPSIIEGGRLVAYLGGSSDFVRDTDLAAIFAANNTLRENANRPTIELDK